MVFRASPLTDPVKPDAFHGLNLLNIGGLHIDTGTTDISLSSATLNNGSASLSAGKHAERLLNIRFSATVKDEDGENNGDSFEVVHRVFPHQTHDRNQNHMYDHVPPTGTIGSAGRTSNASETLHSTSPRSIYSQNMRFTAENNRGAGIGSSDMGARVSGGYSHLKTASLDNNPLQQSQRPPGRKYSLVLPPKSSLTQADGRNTQILQGRQRAAGQLRMNPHQDRRLSSSKQRSRAATINAFGALPPLPSQKSSIPSATKTAMSGSRSSALQSHRPQSSVSTIHSVSSSTAASGPLNYPHLLSLEPSSLGAERISLRRRPSVGSVLATESLRNVVRPRATVGTIELSFEAPPKVGLGKELAVNAYVSNNTNTHYFRLCLVDGNGTDAAGDVVFEPSSSTGTQGLIPMNHTTSVPPLRPGESTFVTLQYIAAAPYFHAVDILRLVNLDADTADKTVTSIDSPFIVFVDDCNK
ncbi:hypothetical protein GGI22_000967 [Coemansia erecta]|nr:hypothetical protein GGI22_000967 [Coemansia erecta]